MIGDKNMDNRENIDILQTPHLKKNPYVVPDGYFASVEDSVHKKIHKEPESPNPLLSFLKTSVALASVFGIVFGFGYGAMYLTNTLDTSGKSADYIVAETDSPLEKLLIETIGTANIVETCEEIDNYPNMSDTLVINKEQIEQYLIDSNISITALASLE